MPKSLLFFDLRILCLVGGGVLFLILVLVSVSVFFIFKWRKDNRESEAIRLDCDMSSKFWELVDDPFMNDSKWKEWLPIFEFSDEEVRRKTKLPLGNQARLVRTRIMDQDLTDS